MGDEVDKLLGEPAPAIAEQDLGPVEQRWRAQFRHWDAESESQQARDFDRLFITTYAQVCCQCHHRRCEPGYSRCDRCRRRNYRRRRLIRR